MTVVITLVALAAFSLALNAVTGNKDRPDRLLIWLGLLWLILAGFMTALTLVFHPQTWVLWLGGFALVLVTPQPKWTKRPMSNPPPRR